MLQLTPSAIGHCAAILCPPPQLAANDGICSSQKLGSTSLISETLGDCWLAKPLVYSSVCTKFQISYTAPVCWEPEPLWNQVGGKIGRGVLPKTGEASTIAASNAGGRATVLDR